MSTTATRATVTGAHLVGSVNLATTDDVLRAAATHLGGHLQRIPDGETGERYYWLQFLGSRFERTAGLVQVGDRPVLLREQFDRRPFALDGSVVAADLRFPDLGYAAAATASFVRFAALQDEGVIPAGTRFQVSLPTPAAIVGVFFVPGDRAAVEPVVEHALYGELDRILAAVPHDRLVVQWDTALEFAWIEGATMGAAMAQAWWDDVIGGVVQRAVQEAGHVPADVPVGFHLCYGDVEETHFVQPRDAGNLAAVMRGVLDRTPRPIAWFHLPVPIERDDPDYFAPLRDVEVPDGTEVVLGLVHPEDGVEGALRRIDAASTAVDRFGIGAECGLGRGERDATVPMLDLHRQVLEAAAR